MSKLQEFDNLRFKYGSHREEMCQIFRSNEKKYVYRSYAVTKLGEIEINEWASLMEKLINKYNEVEIQNKLYEFTSRLPWLKNEQDIKLESLIKHSMRIFENEDWVNYKEFSKTNMFKLFKDPQNIKKQK